MRNLLIGFIHIFINDPYNLKILLLIFIELIFLFYQIIIIRHKKCFLRYLDSIWLKIINTFIRIILIFRFFLIRNENNLN